MAGTLSRRRRTEAVDGPAPQRAGDGPAPQRAAASRSSGDSGTSASAPAPDWRGFRPSRPAMVALNLAVGSLPAAHRQRYALEFLAELHDVGRSGELRHALGLVAHAADLRLALLDGSPLAKEGPAMRKSIRCILHLHHDVKRYNGEAQPPTQYLQCTRCGRQRDTTRRPPPGIGY